MEYDKDKVDEMTLALMYLVMSREREGGRAWKGIDWQTMDRLRQKGWKRFYVVFSSFSLLLGFNLKPMFFEAESCVMVPKFFSKFSIASERDFKNALA
jgi:hypothetical protein